MLTKEQKAEIARQNGAKSRGPKTEAGKNRSRANGLKHGERATTLQHLAQPHPAILCNEDQHNFFQLFHDLIKVYQPRGAAETDIVREIAIARTDITRTQLIKASLWNRTLLLENAKDLNVQPELRNVEVSINTGLQLLKSDAQFDRAIDRLFRRIAQLEKRLRFLQTQFPMPEQTQPESEQLAPNERLTEIEADEDLPLYTDDPSQATREAYEYFFPGRKLIVVPREQDLDPN